MKIFLIQHEDRCKWFLDIKRALSYYKNQDMFATIRLFEYDSRQKNLIRYPDINDLAFKMKVC